MRRIAITLAVVFALVSVTAVHSQVTVETITGELDASGGVSIDDSGIVYVADFGQTLGFANGTNVYQVIGDSQVLLFASGFQGASGNAFDSEGNFWQSNIAGGFVSKVAPDGQILGGVSTGIAGPVGVAVGAGDTVFVANCGSNSIARIAPSGVSSVWVSSPLLSCPNGLTIDTAGNLYTCNFNTGDVVKITPDSQVSVLATLPGGRCGHLTYFEGYLYVAARCSHQIYRVSLDGEVVLVAGSGGRGNNDGSGLEATFNHPNGIEAMRVGDDIVLYVNDAVSLSGHCTSVPLNPIVMRKITIGPDDFTAIADPDRSHVAISHDELQANGSDSAEITIYPINFMSEPILSSIDSISVTNTGGGSVTSPAIDNLDGSYTAFVVAPTSPGYDTVTVTVDAVGDPVILADQPTLLYWLCGDVNLNGEGPNLTDVTYMVNALFLGGPSIPLSNAADFNSDGMINLTDLTLLVNDLFVGGPDVVCSSAG